MPLVLAGPHTLKWLLFEPHYICAGPADSPKPSYKFFGFAKS